MTGRKGFTLLELIVVFSIIGILTVMTVPMYSNYIQQGIVNTALNNMATIYGAQNDYYLKNGSYCTLSCDNLADINTVLRLTLAVDNNFNYICSTASAAPNQLRSTGFQCTATYGSIVLTLTDAPLVQTTNPSCTGSSYCPS